MTRISVGIVTFDSAAVIGPTLAALADCTAPDLAFRVFLLDNGSQDGTLDVVAPFLADPRFTWVRSPRGNVGFGAGHNQLLPLLDSDFHLVLNPDATVDAGTLTGLAGFLEEHPDVGMAVPRIEDASGKLQYLCRRTPTPLDLLARNLPGPWFAARRRRHAMQDKDHTRPFDVPFASGCAMMIRTALFRQLGGFDERFFLYAEDADLTRRINAISRTVYVPTARVVHLWRRGSHRSLAHAWMHLRSLLRYFRKWGWRAP